MKITRERADGSQGERVRKPQRHRRTSHNLPLWLMQPAEQQAIAQKRTLMILSVLSGQKSVQEAIEADQVSRALYYQLEDRGLQGMLKALSPRIEGVRSDQRELAEARTQIEALTERVKSLTQRKRSAERLLRLLIKTNQARVTTERRGRPRKALSTTMMPGGDLP
jgi:DNA repair exonuclease SbcCD ATPase subunit